MGGAERGLFSLLLAAALVQGAPVCRSTEPILRTSIALRGGGSGGSAEPPLVRELFELGLDKNLYTRATFYNEHGQRIPPPKAAFSPGPEKENWAAQEMEAMAHRVAPSEWPAGHPGYDGHPFAGVQRPGWFLEEYIEEESADPHVQELNRALWHACALGDAEEANALIEKGAQVNAGDPRDGDMWSALFYCCTPPPAAGLPDAICNDTALVTEQKRLALLDCLLAHGALIQARDIWGETPLHYAAVRGYPKLCARLIEVGVDVHAENMYGCTAQRNAEVNSKYVPSCGDAAQVIEDAGGDDFADPDQDPFEVEPESARKGLFPEGVFEKMGSIPPMDQIQTNPDEEGYGLLRPEVAAYLKKQRSAEETLRAKMEKELILKADDSPET